MRATPPGFSLQTKIKEIISTVSSIPVEDIADDASYTDDLGLDSLTLLVATGVESRAGKFESAAGGTLFLDEIGDMAPETQARILRVLQEGEVYRLGGQEPRSADVRILAASHRDLEAMQGEGSFRSDLYHRIADWTVRLPRLAERREIRHALANHSGNVSGAAKELQMGLSTLYRRMQALGVDAEG